jgi:hypothetical protein
MKRFFVKLWSLAIGLVDLLTGIMLVVVPMWTLDRMRVPLNTDVEGIAYMSWVGVFVGCIGLSYLLGLWKDSGIEMGTVWRLTSIIRMAVAVFVVVAIVLRRLDGAWALVGVTDAVIAVVQIFAVRKGWLDPKPLETPAPAPAENPEKSTE